MQPYFKGLSQWKRQMSILSAVKRQMSPSDRGPAGTGHVIIPALSPLRLYDQPAPQTWPLRTRPRLFSEESASRYAIITNLSYSLQPIFCLCGFHSSPVQYMINQGAKPRPRCRSGTADHQFWVYASTMLQFFHILSGWLISLLLLQVLYALRTCLF